MKNFSHEWNRTSSCWAAIAFYGICGLLLLLWPNLALSIANYALAAILCVAGAICIISYIRGSVMDGVLGIRLAFGLVLLCFGVLLLFSSDFLGSLLPLLWGLSLLIGGFGKVQMSFDLMRIGEKRWWIMLLCAAFSFVLGSFAIARPMFIGAAITQFIGVALLVEAVQDLIAFITINKQIKEFRKRMEKASAEL